MRLDEQVLLNDERRERNELSALLHLLLRLVEREQEHVFEHLRNLGDFLRRVFNSAIGHKVAPLLSIIDCHSVVHRIRFGEGSTEKAPAIARACQFVAEEEGFARPLREPAPLPRKLGRANS